MAQKPSRSDRMYGKSPSIRPVDDDNGLQWSDEDWKREGEAQAAKKTAAASKKVADEDDAAAEGASFPKSRAALKKLKDTSPAADKGDDDGG